MGAIADLWKSERGLLAVLLIVGATVLAGLKILTADQWIDFTKFVFVTYTAAKTVTGGIEIVKGVKGAPTPEAEPTPTPVPSPAPAGQV